MQKRNLIVGLLALAAACSCSAVSLPVQAAEVQNPVSSSMQNEINAVVSLINQERAEQGLHALKNTAELNQAAEIRSQELVQIFSHTRPDGRNCSSVLNDSGIAWQTTGENIAYGYDSPEAVMNGWMNSEGHRANILNAGFDSVGIGIVSHNGVLYWTQIFTGGTEYDGEYYRIENPVQMEIPVTIPEESTETENSLPEDICIGDSCFTCAGTECTVPQNLFSCLTGNCNTQNILSVLNQNCQNGSCNTIQSVFRNFCK